MNSKMSYDIGFDIVEPFTAPDFIKGERERFYKVMASPDVFIMDTRLRVHTVISLRAAYLQMSKGGADL
jgi:hypothetical protein